MKNMFDLFRMITDKSKCCDIFAETIVDGVSMYQERQIKEKMFYSMQFKKMTKKLQQIQLFKKIAIKLVSCYDCPIYIMLTLEESKINKQLFVYQVEQGDEAIVPKCLAMGDLPQSYQFYNPILRIIESLIQNQKKVQFVERNDQLFKQAYMEQDFISKFGTLFRTRDQKLKFAEFDQNKACNHDDPSSNLNQRLHRVDTNDIDYLKSPHAMSL